MKSKFKLTYIKWTMVPQFNCPKLQAAAFEFDEVVRRSRTTATWTDCTKCNWRVKRTYPWCPSCGN